MCNYGVCYREFGNSMVRFFFFKQKTAYEMCGRDWSSDVCSSDLPGEVSGGIDNTRLIWGALSMLPFLYIVYTLYVGLGEAINRQPDDVKGLVSLARNVTVFSWFFYPIVYFAPFVIDMEGSSSFVVIEVGYTIADIIANAAFGVLIYTIAVRKSEAERSGAPALSAAE